jgi:hypothetical protein
MTIEDACRDDNHWHDMIKDCETGDPLEVFTRMEFAFTVPTEESASRFAERIDAFLRTSQWGDWKLQDGDHVRRRYRRGKWVKKGLFGPLAGGERIVSGDLFWSTEALKAAKKTGFKSNPSWPFILETLFRPLAGAISVRLIFVSGLDVRREPSGVVDELWMVANAWIDQVKVLLHSIILQRPERDEWKLQRDERRRVAMLRYLNYVVKCVRGEVRGMVEYLAAAYGLNVAPTLSEDFG